MRAMTRLVCCLGLCLWLAACTLRATPTPQPSPTAIPTATAIPTLTPRPTRPPEATLTPVPTIPIVAPVPTLSTAVGNYAREVAIGAGRLSEYLAAVTQACAGFDEAACRRAYYVNRPLYDKEVARLAALEVPTACAVVGRRLTTATDATGRVFTTVDRTLRGQLDPFSALGAIANDAATAGQALLDLSNELTTGTCR